MYEGISEYETLFSVLHASIPDNSATNYVSRILSRPYIWTASISFRNLRKIGIARDYVSFLKLLLDTLFIGFSVRVSALLLGFSKSARYVLLAPISIWIHAIQATDLQFIPIFLVAPKIIPEVNGTIIITDIVLAVLPDKFATPLALAK